MLKNLLYSTDGRVMGQQQELHEGKRMVTWGDDWSGTSVQVKDKQRSGSGWLDRILDNLRWVFR